MKVNKIEHKNHTGLIATAVIVALAALGVGLTIGYDKLRSLYLEQCVITDMPSQVRIVSGKMVHPSTIADELGLRSGTNLALVDFVQKRKELLAKIPNLRSVHITRELPNKVSVTAEERTPVARMSAKGEKGVSGRVVDSEGMVFIWQRGTQSLPVIRETPLAVTEKGRRIRGRTLAALRLIEACQEPGLSELNLLDVDTTKPDFLTATLGNYSKLVICWDEMDEHTPAAMKDLNLRLNNLLKAIRSNVSPDTKIWNATMPDTIYANTQQKI